MTGLYIPQGSELKAWAVVVDGYGTVIESSEVLALLQAKHFEDRGRSVRIVPMGPVPAESEKPKTFLSDELEAGCYWEYVRSASEPDSEVFPRLVEVVRDGDKTYIWFGEECTPVIAAFRNAFYLPADRKSLDQVDYASAVARMPVRKWR